MEFMGTVVAWNRPARGTSECHYAWTFEELPAGARGKEEKMSAIVSGMLVKLTSRVGPFVPFFIFLLVTSVLSCWTSIAQVNSSTVRGTATDQTKAVIPGVAITLTEVTTKIDRSAVTDDSGDYEIPFVRPGTYRLTAVLPGFKTFVVDNITLESSQIKRVDFILEVGEQSEHVTVSAAERIIQTETAKLDSKLTDRQYIENPIADNRGIVWYMLPFLPNMQSTGLGELKSAGINARVQGRLDMDGFTQHGGELFYNAVVSMEDVQEFKLNSINNSAEFSRPTNLNVVTKSGSNKIHGGLSYHHQNATFRARDFFAASKPSGNLHHYGAQISGPVIRDKTFFFFSYWAQHIANNIPFLQDTPTEAMRTGDFSQFLSLGTTIKDPLTGNPFPGNIIPSNRLSPVSLKVQDSYFPKPNVGGPNQVSRNFRWLFTGLDPFFMIAFRIDHKLSENNTFTTKISHASFYPDLNGNWPGFEERNFSRGGPKFFFNDTHVFTEHLVTEFGFGFNKDWIRRNPSFPGGQDGKKLLVDLGLGGIPNPPEGAGFPIFNITGFPPLSVPGTFKNSDFGPMEGKGSLSWSIGRNVFKFGGSFLHYSQHNIFLANRAGALGSYLFNGSLSNNSYADFLLGLPFSSVRLLDPLMNRRERAYETGFYGQDSFKVNQRLTIDYGLRWDFFSPASYEDSLQYKWDPDTGNVVVPEKALSLVSRLYPSTIKVVPGKVVPNADKTNFAPRLGVAYRPREKMVIRGGWAMFTEFHGWDAFVQTGGPFEISETYFNRIVDGQPLFQFPRPFPTEGTVAPVIPAQSVGGYPRDVKNGYYQQFNVTVERQISTIGFRLSYIGTRGGSLRYAANINKPQPSLTPFSAARRPYPQYVDVTNTFFDGKIKYDGLQIETQRRVGDVMFDAHWTWSNSLSKMLNLENPYNRLQWNRDGGTVRHRVAANVIWDLPFGRGHRFLADRPAVVNHIVGGWSLTWLAHFQTGQYFTAIFSGSDPSNTNTFGGIPDRIANGNLPTDQRTIDRWFDASAFAVPPKGRFGNSGVNILQGPGLQAHYLTASKGFNLNERLTLKYQAAISNLFNHPNFAFPAMNISVPGQVGKISGTYSSLDLAGARNIRMSLRLDF
jgi:hypothetical protein